jgi:hypothetical protein
MITRDGINLINTVLQHDDFVELKERLTVSEHAAILTYIQTHTAAKSTISSADFYKQSHLVHEFNPLFCFGLGDETIRRMIGCFTWEAMIKHPRVWLVWKNNWYNANESIKYYRLQRHEEERLLKES